MEHIQLYIGYAAGILGFVPYFFIIRSMKRGITKPNLAGWVLYVIAMSMIAISSIALGAWQAVWLALAYVVGNTLVIGVALRRGYFAFSRFDYGCLGISLFSLVLWISTSNPLYALVLNVAIDVFGTFAIAHKLYQHPGTEDKTAWVLAFLVALLNVGAVVVFDLAHALYPVVLALSNFLIMVFAFRKS